MKHFPLSRYLEIPATFAGLLNVYLAARANIWNWLFGMITVSLYAFIFFQAKLYADMSLQFIFLYLQFYGCYQWLYGGEQRHALAIRRADLSIYLIAGAAIFILFSILCFALQHYTDSTTIYIDALTTSLSLVAQWMMSKKWLEHWLLWLLIDVISIKMYLIKQLYFTSGLYVVFFIICVFGYINWRRKLLDIKNKKINMQPMML